METRFEDYVNKVMTRPSSVSPIATILFIATLMTIIGVEMQLYRYTEQMKREQRHIIYLEVQIERLNAAEWEAIGGQRVEPELVAKVAETRREVEKTIAVLAEGVRKQQIIKSFHEYTAVVDEEYRLIIAGNKAQATALGEERVDPSFTALNRVIQEAGREIDNAIEQTAWIEYGHYLLTVILAALVILILFRKFNRSRHLEGMIGSAYKELRNVFNSAAEGIRVVDKDFNIISVNRVFCDLSGLSEEEVISKKCYETLEGPYCHTPQCTLTEILNGQERVEYRDVARKRPDGRKIPCWFSAVPFLAPDGTILGIVENVKDITLQKQAEELLHRRMLFEQFVTSLSTQFINCSPWEIDDQINYSLQLVGEFAGVDRCYSFLISEDGRFMGNTHEWCAEGIESQKDRRKNIPVYSLPWLKEQIYKSGQVYIADVNDLGLEAKAERELFIKRQIKSLLIIPVTFEKSLIGFLGFDSVRAKKIWSKEYISLFGTIGEIIANALMRQKTEKMLRISEERFRATFEQAAVGVVHVDLDGQWILVNQKFCDMVSYTKEEAVKMKFVDITHPEDINQDQENVSRILAGETDTFSMDKRYIRKNRSIVWVNLTVSLVRQSSGEPQYFIGVIQDISDRKQAEIQIKEQKEFAENLVQNSSVPTFVLNPQHKVLIWNKACEEMTGVRAKDVVGTDLHWKAFYNQKRPCISDIIIDNNLEDLPSLYRLNVASDTVSDGLHAEAWLTGVGGQQRYLVLDSAPIRNNNGELTAVIETLRDFTEWKLAEQSIFKENERVKKDLQLANIVQSSLVPVCLPALPGVSVAASTVSAKDIGGDYCDLFITKDQKLGIGIGDVMGKGIPAALLASMAYAFIRSYNNELTSPRSLLNRLNKDMFPQLEFSGQFMTFFYAVYDPDTGELRYSNAGHNKPIMFLAASGKCETLNVKNFYLGGRHDASYREGTAYLSTGDIVLFYSDGLVEGRNKDKEEFGRERVMTLLREYSSVDPASIQELISSEFMQFLNDENPTDDVTIQVLKVNHVS